MGIVIYTVLRGARLSLARDDAVRALTALSRSPDATPLLLIAAIAAGGYIWNIGAGLIWAPNAALATLLTTALVFVGIAAIFSSVRSNRLIAELAMYIGLWAIFPIFANRLDYLSATFDFPLQDVFFARADAALGFDWLAWTNFSWSHPFVIRVLVLAYQSYFIQPIVVVCLIALWGQRGRNREFLTAAIIASLLTVAISTIVPAFGPNHAYGILGGGEPVLQALRAGMHTTLSPNTGIVTFPSFHAAMAVLLTAAMRFNRYTFAAASILNGLMLLSTIPVGKHYLVDVIAGCAVAIISLYAARRTVGRLNLATWIARRTQNEPTTASNGANA